MADRLFVVFLVVEKKGRMVWCSTLPNATMNRAVA